MLREQLQKDPQFQVALELVQDRDMYDRIITPADAKVDNDKNGRLELGRLDRHPISRLVSDPPPVPWPHYLLLAYQKR